MEGFVDHRLICRACLKIVESTTQSFGYIEDATGNLRDMLLCCVPEMDVFVSYNPIVCIQCIQALINVYQFKSRCINTETIIRTFMKKHNLNEDNPVNLSAVVQELIEINNFCKQQEERRRHMAFEQQRNNVAHHFVPSPHFLDSLNQPDMPISKQQNNNLLTPTPPLNILEGMNQILGNIPKQSYPQMPRPSFVRSRSPSNLAIHNLGLPHQNHSGLAKPLRSPMLMSHLEAPSLNTTNGFTLPPIQSSNVPIQHNIVESSTSNNESEISSNRESSNIADENSISKINDLKIDTVNENIKKTENKCNLSEKSNTQIINYHPIESDRRLVIKIPRYKITVPYKIKSNFKDSMLDNSDDKSYETEDATLDNSIDPSLEDIQIDMDKDIPEDFPEYIPEVGSIEVNQIYNEENRDTSMVQPKNITKIFNCACMYLTTSETLYQQHKERCKRAKKNVVKCPHCPHITNRTYALNKHINTMHTKSVWFHCEFCTYRSTDKSCLRRHVRKNHEEKPDVESGKQFCCNICNMAVATEHNLNRHMMKHEETINANYKCDFCSYNSKDRSNYRKHIFTHSPIQLQCPNCHYMNVSPYQLRTHIKRFHDGAGIETADCKSETPIIEIVNDIKEMISRIENFQANERS